MINGEMSARELGHPVHIRVVTNQAQFAKWWPEFVQSVGSYPMIGLNCQKNSQNALVQMDRLRHRLDDDPAPVSQQQRAEWDRIGPEVEGDFDYDYEVQPDESDPVRNRDLNAKLGRVSLIQLASFGGNVILFRSCFFENLPPELLAMLEQDVVKVGQGLEKDKRNLLESFGVIPSCFVDIRQVCARWPYFTAQFDFERYGIRSIAKWMLGCSFDEWGHLSPYWITRKLEEEQIRAAAEEVQLYVDIFTLTMLRYLGWTLPKHWLNNDYFGQIMFFWAAPLFEKPFLDSKFRPVPVKDVSITAGKRAMNHGLMGKLKEEFAVKGKVRLATLWAWPLPGVQTEVEKMMTREPGTALPSSGYPFVAINLHQLMTPYGGRIQEDEESVKDWATTIHMVGEATERGRSRKYRMKITVSTVDENRLEGGDGGGAPLAMETAFAEGCEGPERVSMEENLELAYAKVKSAAEKVVPFLATRLEWKRIEAKNGNKGQEMDGSTLLKSTGYVMPGCVFSGSHPLKSTDVDNGKPKVEEQKVESVNPFMEEIPRSRYDKFYRVKGRQYPSKKDVYIEAEHSEDERNPSQMGILSNGPIVQGTKHAGSLFIKPEQTEEEEGAHIALGAPDGRFDFEKHRFLPMNEGQVATEDDEHADSVSVSSFGDGQERQRGGFREREIYHSSGRTRGFRQGFGNGPAGFRQRDGRRGGFGNGGFSGYRGGFGYGNQQRSFESWNSERSNWRDGRGSVFQGEGNRYFQETRGYRRGFGRSHGFGSSGGFMNGGQRGPAFQKREYRPYQGRVADARGRRPFGATDGAFDSRIQDGGIDHNRSNGFTRQDYHAEDQQSSFQYRGRGFARNFRRFDDHQEYGGDLGRIRGRGFTNYSRWNRGSRDGGWGEWNRWNTREEKGGFDTQSGSVFTARREENTSWK